MDRFEKIKHHLALTPDDNFLQHAMALELEKRGDDEGARGYFERLLAKDPYYIGSYLLLGQLLERNNLIDEAIDVYARGMQIARDTKDIKALKELRAAYEELTM